MMNEWILSSSILIAAVLLGRQLLRGRIKARLQYALWGIVLVRLLLPVQLFTSDFGAGTIAREVDISAPVREVYFSANEDRYEREYTDAYRYAASVYESAGQSADPIVIEQTAREMAQETIELDLKALLKGIWLAGMGVMTAVIAACNLHLSRQLRRRRWEYPAAECLLPVYVTKVLPTPCIFGIFCPVIYLTPEAAADEKLRHHVLVHEQTHYRHGDHIWSVLRSVCLVLHWYNPLVWLAVKASKTDAELACDEGVLARLGEEERGDYGRTLIGLTCASPLGDYLLTATTMTGSAGSIRQRIRLLMARPRNTLLALTAVVLIGTIVVGYAFSGAPEKTTDPQPTETEPQETTRPNGQQPDKDMSYQGQELPIPEDPESLAFFQALLNPGQERGEADWYSQALTSYYDSPAGIDLFQLFYNGIPGGNNTPGDQELAFLESQPGYQPELDLFRIPGQEMARVLREYFGTDMAATLRVGLENFIYDPDTDCYYHSHSDTNLSFRTVTGARELQDGDWQVFYTGESSGGVVTLRQKSGKWEILSNLPAEVIEPVRFTDANGLLVYPGTRWNMTEEELIQALDLQEYGIFSGLRGIHLPETTFLGYPASVAFLFTRHSEENNWGLSSVRVTLEDEAAANAVWDRLYQALGKPDFWTSGVASGMWYSDARIEELVSGEAWAEYRKIIDGQELAEAGKKLLESASSITWLGDSPPNPSNQVLFDGNIATAMQIEAALGRDSIAEVRSLLGENGDPELLAALTYLWSSAGFRESKTAAPFIPEIVDCVQVDADTVLVYYRRPGAQQLYQAVLVRQEDRWAVAENILIFSMADYADRNPRELRQNELREFQTAFSVLNGGDINPAACFLLPCYADISEMDGSEFLANFPTDQEGTREEFDLLKEKYPEFFEHWTFETMPVPIHRYSAKEIEAVITRYTNIHWADLDEGVHYLEETGCYYNYTSDFGLGGFQARGGFVYDGGAVVYGDFSALFLTETKGQYSIQAHLPALGLLNPSSQPMIPADDPRTAEVQSVLDAFFLAYQENSYLYTDHDYDSLTVRSAEPKRTVVFEGKTVPLSDFHQNIEYLHDKEAYWKHVRQDQGISRTGFSTSCRILQIDFDDNIAYVLVGSGVTFTYADSPDGASSGMSSDFEVLLIQVDGRWLVADVLELDDWFDGEYKNNPDFDVNQLIGE